MKKKKEIFMPETNPNLNTDAAKNGTSAPAKGFPGMSGDAEKADKKETDAEIAARLSNVEGSMDDQFEDRELSEEDEDAFVDADVDADKDLDDDLS